MSGDDEPPDPDERPVQCPDRLRDIVIELGEQAEDLCAIEDHISRVIGNLNINEEWFSDYKNPNKADFRLESIVKIFLYKHVRGFNQLETVRRLRGAAFLYVKFKLPRAPTQGSIYYNWRERLNHDDRALIEAAADLIRRICADHDIVDKGEPTLDPEDIRGHDIEEDQIMEAVEGATELGFEEFDDPRAENCKYALQAYMERQGYICMANAGTTTKRRRFARLSDRPVVPHGSSHNRTMKKIAAPDPQTDLWDFVDQPTPDWKRIRDAVLPAFHRGVENMLDEIAGHDRSGIREPVNAAFDITTWPY